VVSSALGVTGGSNHAWVWSAQNRLTRVPLGQGRAAVVSSALGVTGDFKRAWVWSAQNRLTRVPRGQARAGVVSSALGVTGGTIQRAVAPSSTAPALSVYRGTLACRQRVKRFRQARAGVRSSALGVTGGSVQRAVAPNSTPPALSVYRGTLACRQRVKRFRAVHAARALERVGRDRWFQSRLGLECAESFNPCAARPGTRRCGLERVGRDR
jgi:hypothetical protein